MPNSRCESSGISGLGFQQQLKKAGLQIPIVFITARDIPMTVKAMTGAVESLTNPVEDKDLLGWSDVFLDVRDAKLMAGGLWREAASV